MLSTYPLNIDVTSPARVSRWRPLLNWLLVIPPLLWLMILTIGLEVVAFISWFTILFTGQLPASFGGFMVQVLRYQWRSMPFCTPGPRSTPASRRRPGTRIRATIPQS